MGCVRAIAHVWRSEDSLVESDPYVPAFTFSRDRTQIVSLGDKYLNSLSYLAGQSFLKLLLLFMCIWVLVGKVHVQMYRRVCVCVCRKTIPFETGSLLGL